MTKRYMVGTLDDYPLVLVELDMVRYFVHEKDKKAFKDEPGLPRVTDEKILEAILRKAKEL